MFKGQTTIELQQFYFQVLLLSQYIHFLANSIYLFITFGFGIFFHKISPIIFSKYSNLQFFIFQIIIQ